MEIIVGHLYHLSGDSVFGEECLKNNDNIFTCVSVHLDSTDTLYTFAGLKNGRHQIARQEWIENETAIVKPFKVRDAKQKGKRKKGSRRKLPTVNKAKITFMSGESYTVKDFVAIEASAEKIVFIMEDNWKGTVNYRQAITVPNDDVDTVFVRGVQDQFELDMALTNMGVTILRSDNAEILASELNIKL